MKVCLLCLLMFMFVPMNCMAMTLSQPQYIGKIIAANIGGFAFEGEVDNKGVLSKHQKLNRSIYDKGVAVFGKGNDALYFYYEQGSGEFNKPTKMFIGGSDINSLIDVNLLYTEISKISTDEGITMYMLHDSYDLPEEDRFILIGRRNDGKWVKYFDSSEMGRRYFNNEGWGLAFSDFKVIESEVILNYERNFLQEPISRGRKSDEYGKFIFSWDKTKQWFAVRRVVN